MNRIIISKFWSRPHPSDIERFVHENMLSKLLNTGNRELVYALPTDKLWGIGYRPGDAAANRAAWGSNLLGRRA
jgi:predicted NAD-dependent protein-ADP-ribosyltransferase YbiA (DUF1768 family)